MGFWVFDFFFFFVGFGCDCGLWLKWWFGGCVGSGLVAVVVITVGCVGLGCNSGLRLWLCWWWFDFFFFFSCRGLCWVTVVAVLVVVT